MSAEDMRKGVVVLKRRLSEVEQLDPRTVSEHNVTALERSIDEALERTFGKGTSDYNR